MNKKDLLEERRATATNLGVSSEPKMCIKSLDISIAKQDPHAVSKRTRNKH